MKLIWKRQVRSGKENGGNGRGPKKLELKDRKLDFIDNLAIVSSFISIIAYFVILELGQFNGLWLREVSGWDFD